jgi:FkbM family methyltransferase
MNKYGLIFKGISDGGRVFHIINNTKESRTVIMTIYNSYFEYPEEIREITYHKDAQYWNYVVHNSNHRYVQFVDKNTSEIVGLFGLEGEVNFEDYDYNSYAKRIFNLVPDNNKGDIVTVFNEIVCSKTYFNEWVDVEEGDVVVDIGFNYGLFSVASRSKNALRIVGFEPNPKLFEIFNKNFIGDRIDLHNYAVSNKNGTVIFFETGNSVMSSIKEEVNKEFRKNSMDVNCININTLLEIYDLQKIDYLKVDCEGSEFDIFNEISDQYLRDNIKKIAIEFHDYFDSENVQNLIKKLENSGFDTFNKYEVGYPLGMIYAKKR